MDSAPLAQAAYSLDHDRFQSVLSTTQNLLIIQDLDGVCMPLVKDPLNRQIDPDYITATEAFDGHFYVLTNGEHIGKRGVNRIVERAFGDDQPGNAAGHYLPGLAAGGVQWQDRLGAVSHPGVSESELAFLKGVITAMEQRLRVVLPRLGVTRVEPLVAASVLDNVASPTVNLNLAYEITGDYYPELQGAMHRLMEELLNDSQANGLQDSFFVHYAPNLGQDDAGNDILRPATPTDSGTTDFQFMVRGGIKEAGVVALLNRYYHQHFGHYPLGPEFNVRQASASLPELQRLVLDHFDLDKMPLLVGVGDTVTSRVTPNGVQRGGSDRNFLQLIHNLGQATGQPHLTVYVDSSRGEVKNRKSLKLATIDGVEQVAEGPGDPEDHADPLRLNVAFPGGYKQYTACIKAAAKHRTR